MLPVALEYPPGDCNGFRVYRPARGGRSDERFGGYRTINRIPLYSVYGGCEEPDSFGYIVPYCLYVHVQSSTITMVL